MIYVLFVAAFLVAFPSYCGEFAAEMSDAAVCEYDVNAWEDMDTDYDQICEVAEYEKPSAIMIWLRSMGGAMYVGICSAREYVVAKWYAMQKVLGFKKRKLRNEIPT